MSNLSVEYNSGFYFVYLFVKSSTLGISNWTYTMYVIVNSIIILKVYFFKSLLTSSWEETWTLRCNIYCIHSSLTLLCSYVYSTFKLSIHTSVYLYVYTLEAYRWGQSSEENWVLRKNYKTILLLKNSLGKNSNLVCIFRYYCNSCFTWVY